MPSTHPFIVPVQSQHVSQRPIWKPTPALAKSMIQNSPDNIWPLQEVLTCQWWEADSNNQIFLSLSNLIPVKFGREQVVKVDCVTIKGHWCRFYIMVALVQQRFGTASNIIRFVYILSFCFFAHWFRDRLNINRCGAEANMLTPKSTQVSKPEHNTCFI